MTISPSILSPQGCRILLYGKCNKVLRNEGFECNCGDIIKEVLLLCPQCKKIRQAQIQILIDEKKDVLKFLDELHGELDSQDCIEDALTVWNKCDEMEKEIKTLEGLRE